MTWFGNLDLAYKYTIVFVSLLVITIVAGCIKVLYDRQQLKKHTQAANLEAGKKDDQVELNQREKDEGDLFGIRAIEAGFYAGIPQSRPTSRAGSFVSSRGTSTLLGGASQALKDQGNSMNSSMTTLPLAHTNGERDSSNLEPRRKSPPTIKLAPSEAELNGRINHNAAVNMNLIVPPSPVLARGPSSPTFSDSDSDGQTSPRSLSPRSANFSPDYYSPRAPQLPMPQGLKVSVHPADETPQSQAASFNFDHSAPSTRGPTPEGKLPSLPAKALRDEPRSLFPSEQSKTEPERAPSPDRLLPQTYQPTHMRDMSDASSVYSNLKRTSTHQSSDSTDSSYNFSFPEDSNRNSSALGSTTAQSGQPSASSSLAVPGSTTSNQTNDPRLSEFYDAYYRHSTMGPPNGEGPKRPTQLNLTQETIVEVESPLPSPNPQTSLLQPGWAM